MHKKEEGSPTLFLPSIKTPSYRVILAKVPQLLLVFLPLLLIETCPKSR